MIPGPDAQPVAPLFIGPRNCEHVTGHPWRWVLTFARRVGVPIVAASATGGASRTMLIPSAELAAALRREGAAAEPAPAETEGGDDEDLDALLARLGKRRRTAA